MENLDGNIIDMDRYGLKWIIYIYNIYIYIYNMWKNIADIKMMNGHGTQRETPGNVEIGARALDATDAEL